jgi:hypothetical protein
MTDRNAASGGDRLFADPAPAPDERSFQVDNTSAAYYTSVYYEQHKNQLQPIPPLRVSPPRIDLGEVIGDAAIAKITAANQIAFHAVGDTGAARTSSIAHEGSVADAMADDLAGGAAAGGAPAPSFFFHLGDVVYSFGEGKYYYDQFYEPFRTYDAPIFAIPGNHDGSVFGSSPDTPDTPSLTAFVRNFCAAAPGPSEDAGGLVRSVMTQPGVYFTLDAPLVSIIGLYTNVLEGPGVISSQDGHYPALNDDQLTFLTSELARLKPDRDAGKRAVIIACHHPPASADARHGGATGLSGDLDKASQSAGLWPDAILSGHAHLYQRFSRSVGGKTIPYVVSGSGGYNATKPVGALPDPPVTWGEFTLEAGPIVDYGYLTLAVDLRTQPGTLQIVFHQPATAGGPGDRVTVTLS